FREHGLADTGDVLDEEMPLGDQTGEREPDLVLLALDDLLDVLGEPAERRCEPFPRSGITPCDRRSPRIEQFRHLNLHIRITAPPGFKEPGAGEGAIAILAQVPQWVDPLF